jgi:hypothetical protein
LSKKGKGKEGSNTGVLRCAQDDGEKLATARAEADPYGMTTRKAKAKAKEKAKARARARARATATATATARAEADPYGMTTRKAKAKAKAKAKPLPAASGLGGPAVGVGLGVA